MAQPQRVPAHALTLSLGPQSSTLVDKGGVMTTWRLRVDLHMHTCYSDGADTPAQLVAKASQQGLHSIAVTDHDTLAALPEAQQAGLECGVEVLVGVELTMQYQQYDDIHLLGYFFDAEYPALQARLALV